MPTRVGIALPDSASASVLRKEMLLALERVAELNTDWYLAEWAAGKDPPCCAECGGILYDPDDPSDDVHVDHVAEVIRKGRASCGSVVAMNLGHERAEAIKGGMLRDQARRTWLPYVTVENNDARGFVCHAQIKTPKGIINPVADLKRA